MRKKLLVKEVGLMDINEVKDKNEETFKICEKIGEYLVGYEKFSIPVIVNMHTILLPLQSDVQANSNFIVSPSQSGKSTLFDMLHKNNPRTIVKLPSKVYEWTLIHYLQKNPLISDRKVWTIDDMIVSFGGMSTKSRKQLQGFFIDFLRRHAYERQLNDRYSLVAKGVISCMFGIASENYRHYRGELLEATLFQRIFPIYFRFTREHLDKVSDLCAIRRKTETKYPEIKLKLLNESEIHKRVVVGYTDEVRALGSELATLSGGIKLPTAREHILNFMMANSIINNRDVCEADLKLWCYIKDLYYLSEVKSRNLILSLIIESTISHKATTVEELVAMTEYDERHVYRLLKELVEEKSIQYVRTERGKKLYYVHTDGLDTEKMKRDARKWDVKEKTGGE